MIPIDLIVDNSRLQEALARAAANGVHVEASSAALSFSCVELAMKVYCQAGGEYWTPLWEEVSGLCRGAFLANDVGMFCESLASSRLLGVLLSGADTVPASRVEQTMGMVARIWFMGASGVTADARQSDVAWTVGMVDLVEWFTSRSAFPWVLDCVSANTTNPAIVISRQMLWLAVERRWSFLESYENGRDLANAFAPSVLADFRLT